MIYEDIVEAQRKRDVKEAITIGTPQGSRKRQKSAAVGHQRSCVEELEHGKSEIKALGLEEYCSVLTL